MNWWAAVRMYVHGLQNSDLSLACTTLHIAMMYLNYLLTVLQIRSKMIHPARCSTLFVSHKPLESQTNFFILQQYRLQERMKIKCCIYVLSKDISCLNIFEKKWSCNFYQSERWLCITNAYLRYRYYICLMFLWFPDVLHGLFFKLLK